MEQIIVKNATDVVIEWDKYSEVAAVSGNKYSHNFIWK